MTAAVIVLAPPAAMAYPQSWLFMQSVGGLTVGDAVRSNGRWALPIQADVSGLSAFSAKPSQINSGMGCSKVEATIEDHRIFLTVHTAVASSGIGARCPDAELGLPVAGKYTVFYRGPNAEPVMLKEVSIGP